MGLDDDDLPLAGDGDPSGGEGVLGRFWRASRGCGAGRSPGEVHVAAEMFTPPSLTAVATLASAPGSLSTSITRSVAMRASTLAC